MTICALMIKRAFYLIVSLFSNAKRIICYAFRSRTSSNISELPFIRDENDYKKVINFQLDPNASTWNSWNDRSFEVESKIEQYRKNKAAEMLRLEDKNSESPEPDYFEEMQPKFTAAKKVLIQNKNIISNDDSNPRMSLFEVRENDVYIPESIQMRELGEFDMDKSATQPSEAWSETLIPDAELDAQRRRDARQRALEHERSFLEKRPPQQHQQQSTLINLEV